MPSTQPTRFSRRSAPYVKRSRMFGKTPKKAFARYGALAASSAYSGSLLQRTPITGFPQDMTVRLRYNLFLSYSTGVGTGQHVYQFKINSVFDPDHTGTGHQPLYRDQLYLIYKYCVVTACRWEVNVSTTTTTGSLINIQATTYATADSDTAIAVERGQTAQAFIQLGQPARLTGKVDMAALFGTTKASILSDDLYRHSESNDPSQLCWLTLYTQDTESAQSRYSANVTLDMTCVFKEVNKIASS